MSVPPFTQLLSFVSGIARAHRRAGRPPKGPHLAAIAFCGASLLLVACTPSPPKPAMVAVGANGNYGYTEVMIEPDRYQVSYLTPRLKVANSHADQEAEIASEKARAHDLALWRAAKLGRDKGFAALKILDEHIDSDVTTNIQSTYPPSFYGFYGYRPYHHYPYPGGFGPIPWFPGDYPYGYWPGDSYRRTSSSLRVNSRLEIKFFKTGAEESQKIDDIIADMSKRYAEATYP